VTKRPAREAKDWLSLSVLAKERNAFAVPSWRAQVQLFLFF
jgi:hypothetical protein